MPNLHVRQIIFICSEFEGLEKTTLHWCGNKKIRCEQGSKTRGFPFNKVANLYTLLILKTHVNHSVFPLAKR